MPFALLLKMIRATGCELNVADIKHPQMDTCIDALRAAALREGAEISVLTGQAPNGSSLLALLVKIPPVEMVTKVPLQK